MDSFREVRICVIVVTIVFFRSCLCGLTLAKPCGEMNCVEQQYCSSFGNICQPCSDVCDTHSHNYHMDTCHQQCQDYLHYQQFVRRAESARDAATLADLSRDVKRLQVVAWLSMAFSGISAILLLGLCARKIARAKRQHGGIAALCRNTFHDFKTPKKMKDKDKTVVRADATGLKLDIPPPIAQSTPATAPNTASTILPTTPAQPQILFPGKQRSPSEDATLDYAYDNPGLTPSPTFTKTTEDTASKRDTTTF